MDIAPKILSRTIKQDWGLGAFKRQTGQRLTGALKKQGNKSRRLLSLYGKERYKEILFTDEKNLLWRKFSMTKTIDFIHSHPK